MSELNDLFKQLAEAKAQDPQYQKVKKLEESVKESVKTDLGGLFSQISAVKAEDPNVQKAKKLEKEIHENVKTDLGSLFAELASLKKQKEELIEEHPQLIEEVLEEPVEFTPELVEEVITEVAPLPTPIGNVPDEVKIPEIDKYLKPSGIAKQEEPSSYSKEFKTVNDKIKFLEQWIGKIQNTGPGSGEVNFRYLDDVDRSTIVDGNFLTYNAETRKFEFRQISVSGDGTPHVQSDWTETNTGSAAYIKHKPTLFSGDYNDLSNLPVLFSGDYEDLTNKPYSISWTTSAPGPTNNFKTVITANDGYASITILDSVPPYLNGYVWKFDKTKITFPDNSTQTTAWTGTYSYTNLTDKPTLFSGSYTDLTNKPTIPSLTGYATESFVNTAISNVVGAAPAALDTLKEIADQLASDESGVSALTTTVAGKVSLTGSYANPAWITSLAYSKLTGAPTLATVATTGSYTDLINKPNIPTVPTNISSFANDVGYLSYIPDGYVINSMLDTGIDIGKLTYSYVTINGTSVQLGQSATVTAAAGSLTGGTLNSTVTASSLTSVGTLTNLRVAGGATTTNNSATDKFIQVGTKGQLFDDGNLHVHSSSGAVWINSLDGGDIRLGTQTNSGKSNVIVDTSTVGHSFFTKVQTGFNVNEPSVAMDNLNVRLRNTSGSTLLAECSAVSGSFSAYVTIVTNKAGSSMAGDTNSAGITFAAGTWTSINASQSISSGGDVQTFHVIDNTNSRVYRVTAIHCAGTKGGYLSIERMC
jgi:hypothetical protein